jgi:multiple sugar transport system permease protein
MIIYRAAISGISEDLYEAAEIDGAGSITRLFSITIPSIRFQLLYTFVMTTLSGFGLYGQPRLLTKGGPTETTYSIVMYIRNLAFSSGRSIAGTGSAMAMLLGVVMIFVTAFQYWLLNRDNFARGEK